MQLAFLLGFFFTYKSPRLESLYSVSSTPVNLTHKQRPQKHQRMKKHFPALQGVFASKDYVMGHCCVQVVLKDVLNWIFSQYIVLE